MSTIHTIQLVLITTFAAFVAAVSSQATPHRANKPTQGIQIQATTPPRMPEALLLKGITSGLATLVVCVDKNGFLEDWLLAEASDQSLHYSIEQVIDQWNFVPAQKEGQYISARQQFPILIDAAGAQMSFRKATENSFSQSFFDPNDRSEIRDRQQSPIETIHPQELDQVPTLTKHVKPSVAPDAYQQSKGSSVTFVFYLDTEGRVRMPVPSKTSGLVSPAAIFAAQVALEQWRFAPPTRNGKTVITQLAQTINFSHIYQ